MMSAYFFRVVLMVAVSLYAALAQAQPPDEEPVRFRFQAISLGGTIQNIYFWSGGEDRESWIPNGSYSAIYEYEGFGPLTLYTLEPGPEEGYVSQPVGRLPVSEAMDGKYFRILASREAGGAVRLIPVDFSKVRSAPDTYYLVNLCEQDLAIQLGGDRFILEANGRRMLATRPDETGRLPALILRRRDGDFQAEYQDSFLVGEGNQGILLVYPDEDRENVLHARLLLGKPLPPPDPEEEPGDYRVVRAGSPQS